MMSKMMLGVLALAVATLGSDKDRHATTDPELMEMLKRNASAVQALNRCCKTWNEMQSKDQKDKYQRKFTNFCKRLSDRGCRYHYRYGKPNLEGKKVFIITHINGIINEDLSVGDLVRAYGTDILTGKRKCKTANDPNAEIYHLVFDAQLRPYKCVPSSGMSKLNERRDATAGIKTMPKKKLSLKHVAENKDPSKCNFDSQTVKDLKLVRKFIRVHQLVDNAVPDHYDPADIPKIKEVFHKIDSMKVGRDHPLWKWVEAHADAIRALRVS